ncbi:MAG: DNA-processing protein DprA [Candidatus Dojkabacteria bacterium]
MEDIEKIKRIVLNLRLKECVKNSIILDNIAKLTNNDNGELDLLDNDNSILDSKYDNNDSIDQLSSLGISCTFVLENTYPESLKSLKSPPALIFYKGEWKKELFNKTISIVGTRTPTKYGSEMTRKLGMELSYNGFTIVSGMAFGIDREAHLAALESGGPTIAVLASSPNNPTPINNIDIYKSILDKGGLVISDALPNQPILRNSFASRNRIVAGLSEATLIIEAGDKSGTLITAEHARKFNKHVFALPGNINSHLSLGTNKLIKEGKARLITSVDDILNAMNMVNYQGSVSTVLIENLTDNESRTYNAMFDSMYIEEVSLKTQSDISDTLTTLSQLELKGLVSITEEGKYKKLANLIK